MRIGIYLATLEETPGAESPTFTEAERNYCLIRRYPEPHLAGRYAAKRAAAAALALDDSHFLPQIEVVRERGRAPTLHFHADAAVAAQDAGIENSHVSLSHSGDYAVALVVME